MKGEHYATAYFLGFCALFLAHYRKYKDLEAGCTFVSLVHHFLAVIGSVCVIYSYWATFEYDCSLGPNSEYPWANQLNWFNSGYFLYDLIHAFTWDQKWIAHHLVALTGFVLSDYAGCFALGNAGNTFIAEIGSLMYNVFLNHKSDRNYVIFYVVYTATRILSFYWSLIVIKSTLQYDGPFKYPFYAPASAIILQLSLCYLTAQFVWVHTQKIWRMYQRKKKENENSENNMPNMSQMSLSASPS